MQDSPKLINTEENEFEQQWQSKPHKDLSSNNSDSHKSQTSTNIQSFCNRTQSNMKTVTMFGCSIKHIQDHQGNEEEEGNEPTGNRKRNNENLSRTMSRAGVKKSRTAQTGTGFFSI